MRSRVPCSTTRSRPASCSTGSVPGSHGASATTPRTVGWPADAQRGPSAHRVTDEHDGHRAVARRRARRGRTRRRPAASSPVSFQPRYAVAELRHREVVAEGGEVTDERLHAPDRELAGLDRGHGSWPCPRGARGPRPAAAWSAPGARRTARARPCHPPSRAVSTGPRRGTSPARPRVTDPGIGASSGCTPGVRRGTASRMARARQIRDRRRLDSLRVPTLSGAGPRRGALVVVAVGRRPPCCRTPRAAPARAAARRRRPNILFVLTDDLDLAEMRYLPHVQALIGAAGHDLRPLLREQLALLPVAHDHAARAVRAQHRRVDQRRRQRRLRARLRQRRRAGHRRHPAPPRRVHDRRSPASTSTATRTAPGPTTCHRGGTTGRARSTATPTRSTATC